MINSNMTNLDSYSRNIESGVETNDIKSYDFDSYNEFASEVQYDAYETVKVVLEATIYNQLAKLLATLTEGGDCSAEYPIFNYWYIKMGKLNGDYIMQICLYNRNTCIDSFGLEKGEVDSIEITSKAIANKIFREDKIFKEWEKYYGKEYYG